MIKIGVIELIYNPEKLNLHSDFDNKFAAFFHLEPEIISRLINSLKFILANHNKYYIKL